MAPEAVAAILAEILPLEEGEYFELRREPSIGESPGGYTVVLGTYAGRGRRVEFPAPAERASGIRMGTAMREALRRA